jgi:predicted metal-binding membrane protein
MTSSTLVRNTESQAVLLGIALVVGVAWAALLAGTSSGLMNICGTGRTELLPWGFEHAVNVLAMWLVMTPAMMLPAAAIDILEGSSFGRSRPGRFAAASSVCAGYLAVVTAASIVAAGLQWALQSVAMLTDGARVVSPIAGGALLVIAGLYQLSPSKRVSLQRCLERHRVDVKDRDPMAFGLRHGLACIDCCAVMICVQFATGIMNLAWMVALVGWMLAERMLPFRLHLAKLSGIALVVGGGALAFA